MTTTTWGKLREASTAPSLADGIYDFRVADARAGKTRDLSKDQIAAKLEVIAGPQAGRSIKHYYTISPDSPEALQIFFRHMAVLGLDQQFFAQEPSIEQVAQSIVGKYFTADVSHRDWKGVAKINVDNPRPFQGQPPAAPQQPPPGPGLPNPAAAPQVTAPVAPIPQQPYAPQQPQPAYVDPNGSTAAPPQTHVPF